MTWDRFIDVLPIITLVLGYVGSQWESRRREMRDRAETRVAAGVAFERETCWPFRTR